MGQMGFPYRRRIISRNKNAARAKARAKASPKASSEKAAIARKKRADQRSVDAQKMHRNGASVDDIMRCFDVSRATVYNMLNRQNDTPMQPSML